MNLRYLVLFLILIINFIYVPRAKSEEIGNLYGHLPYREAKPLDLVTFQGIKIHKNALASLRQLLAKSGKNKQQLAILSGFRSKKRQQYLFHGIAKRRNQTLTERAKVSAPPGNSEHHTGFAFDFDDAKNPVWLEESFKDTNAGKWLLANGPKFGFELSFPKNNAQGILYEPWHWRWVGSEQTCKIFAAARKKYPETAVVECRN